MKNSPFRISVIFAILIIVLLIFIDQFTKIYIKLNYPITLYGKDAIVDWGIFKILFVENSGMAWGTRIDDFLPFLGEKAGKYILTFLRILILPLLGWWVYRKIKEEKSQWYILSLCLIFAGAIGNIVDSVFYGKFFTHSYGKVAEFTSNDGYTSYFQGHVVDMFQLPIASWIWPQWIPIIGGQHYTFFEYIFNFADSYITVGIVILILINKKKFNNSNT